MLDNVYIFDLEGDGLLDTITKIHCLSFYSYGSGEIVSFSDYRSIKEFLSTEDITLVGHNVLRYDIPALKKVLGVQLKCDVVDTLPLSWILDEKRKNHGLEGWGEEFGVEKLKIADWSSLSTDEYILRCEQDVRINKRLWDRQLRHLTKIYDQGSKNLGRMLKYLRFKMECVAEQEEIGIALDVDKAKEMFLTLTSLKERKKEELEAVMPKVAIKKKTVYENAVEDESGNIFQEGDLFFNSTVSSTIEKEKITGWKEPNANSHKQVKDWLYSLGWVPEHIQHKRNKKTNEVKQIPQIKSQFEPGEICDSIKKLFDKEPKLEVLEGLSILTHRISIFEGMVNDEKEGKLYPSMAGLTNTLRLKHRVVVNLPRAGRKYGEEIRGCLIADKGHVLCGSDLSGLEDSTKRHYIYQYDKEYVERMNVPGYDPHLELAILAKFITREEAEWYKWYDAKKKAEEDWVPEEWEKTEWKRLVDIRYKAKTTNFAATYKVGAPALSRYPGINLGLSEARRVLRTYWELNHAILEVENSLPIKEIYGQKWLFNPISRMWYSLRADKDKFSTLNQGTAVYVFDKWVTNVRKRDVKICLQYHDEWVANVKKGEQENTRKIVFDSTKELNDGLKLNVPIKCSIDFGSRYSLIH